MTPTIEALADGLSEGARIAVLAIGPDGQWADDMPGTPSLYPAYAEYCATRAWCPGVFYSLTTLGLSVRRLLQEREGR